MKSATTVRLRFAKRGDLRLVSHHDLLRCLERMLRRAHLPIAFTQGFNPRPRVTFALALGLGIEAWSEVVDLELWEPRAPAEVLHGLRDVSPAGFDWIHAFPIDAESPSPRICWAEYQLPVPPERRSHARAALLELLGGANRLIVRRRPGREQTFDLRPHVLAAELLDDGVLRFRLKVAPDGSARPEELLDAIQLRDLLDTGAVLVRTNLELVT